MQDEAGKFTIKQGSSRLTACSVRTGNLGNIYQEKHNRQNPEESQEA